MGWVSAHKALNPLAALSTELDLHPGVMKLFQAEHSPIPVVFLHSSAYLVMLRAGCCANPGFEPISPMHDQERSW